MTLFRRLIPALAVVMFALSVLPRSAEAGTLETVRARGQLLCGVSSGLTGFSERGPDGVWRGLDVDFCRAVAAAVLGSAEKVSFQPLSAQERFVALRAGRVDLLARNTTWTLSRDTAEAVDFTGVLYFDGQGVLVPRALEITGIGDLKDRTVCVPEDTTSALNFADHARTIGLAFRAVPVGTIAEARDAYARGACVAFTSDVSGLAGFRVRLDQPTDHVILPEVISKEPLGPTVRHGDNLWRDIVSWTLHVLILAEEMGVTSRNAVTLMKSATRPEVRRLLGAEGDLGERLGLPGHWAYRVISQVGNYGEVFERSLGEGSPLGLARGLNALWTDGGLHYAPPAR